MQRGEINFSNHSLRRMQQRGIGLKALELLLEHGEVKHDGHGGKVVYLNKQKRDFLRADIGKKIYTKIEKQLSAYAVISEDEEVLITVGHRLKKVRR